MIAFVQKLSSMISTGNTNDVNSGLNGPLKRLIAFTKSKVHDFDLLIICFRMTFNVIYLDNSGKDWVWSYFTSKWSQDFGWNFVQPIDWSSDRGSHFTQWFSGNYCNGKHWTCSYGKTHQIQGFRMFQWVKNAKHFNLYHWLIKLSNF